MWRTAAFALVVVVATTASASAQTFLMTYEQLKAKLDERIRADNLDKTRKASGTTKACVKRGNTFTCGFDDRGFQQTVAMMKKLDLMNGRFDQRLQIQFEITNNQVSKIIVVGSRADLPNLLVFNGTVANVVQVFDQNAFAEDGSIGEFARELGLMRGDSADDIGTPIIAIKPYAEIRCLAMPSQLSSAVGCTFIPRS